MGDAEIDQDELDKLLDDMGMADDAPGSPGAATVADPGHADPPRARSFETRATASSLGNTNLNLLLDVTLHMSVELGRARMKVQDVLGVRDGTTIELDKLSGEPVDIRVNDILVARGEIIVIDENYGITITEIIDPQAAMKVRAR